MTGALLGISATVLTQGAGVIGLLPGYDLSFKEALVTVGYVGGLATVICAGGGYVAKKLSISAAEFMEAYYQLRKKQEEKLL